LRFRAGQALDFGRLEPDVLPGLLAHPSSYEKVINDSWMQLFIETGMFRYPPLKIDF